MGGLRAWLKKGLLFKNADLAFWRHQGWAISLVLGPLFVESLIPLQ